jgi:hypothetical protein
MQLAIDDQRVHHIAHIIHRQIPDRIDLAGFLVDLAGFLVDLDDENTRTEGKGKVRGS